LCGVAIGKVVERAEAKRRSDWPAGSRVHRVAIGKVVRRAEAKRKSDWPAGSRVHRVAIGKVVERAEASLPAAGRLRPYECGGGETGKKSIARVIRRRGARGALGGGL